MPPSDLTIAARAASSRMSVDNFSRIEGNLQMLSMIANEDVATMGDLAAAVEATGGDAPPGMVASLTAEANMMRTVSQWSGNIALWSQAYAASGNVWNACDFLDNYTPPEPEPPEEPDQGLP
jgi:hypothetical protein